MDPGITCREFDHRFGDHRCGQGTNIRQGFQGIGKCQHLLLAGIHQRLAAIGQLVANHIRGDVE